MERKIMARFKYPMAVSTFFLIICFIISISYAGGKGKLYVVGMGPAGPDLTAPRALAVTEEADVILCSPGMPKKFEKFGKHIDPDKVAFNPWEGIHGEKAGKLKKTNYKEWIQRVEKQRKKLLLQNSVGFFNFNRLEHVHMPFFIVKETVFFEFGTKQA